MVALREGERVPVNPMKTPDARALDLALTAGRRVGHSRTRSSSRRTASTRRRCKSVELLRLQPERSRLRPRPGRDRRRRTATTSTTPSDDAGSRRSRAPTSSPRCRSITTRPRPTRSSARLQGDARRAGRRRQAAPRHREPPDPARASRRGNIVDGRRSEHRRSSRSRTRSSRRPAAVSARSSSSSTASRPARSGSGRARSATTRTTATSSITSSRTRSSTDAASSRRWHLDDARRIDAPGAMNEGLADYFSSAHHRRSATSASTRRNDIGAARRARHPHARERGHVPRRVVGEVHYDSTLFSGALWTARARRSRRGDRPKFDAALYKAMRTNPGAATSATKTSRSLFLAGR